MDLQKVEFRDLGLMEYKAAWDYQEELLKRNVRIKSRAVTSEQGPLSNALPESEEETRNYLLFVEHPPVFTLGKSGKMENVLIGEEEREEKGIEFFHTNRGGDI